MQQQPAAGRKRASVAWGGGELAPAFLRGSGTLRRATGRRAHLSSRSLTIRSGRVVDDKNLSSTP
jgi:hypothetical protein